MCKLRIFTPKCSTNLKINNSKITIVFMQHGNARWREGHPCQTGNGKKRGIKLEKRENLNKISRHDAMYIRYNSLYSHSETLYKPLYIVLFTNIEITRLITYMVYPRLNNITEL